MTNAEIINLKENKNLTHIGESTFDGSPIFLVEQTELFGYEVAIQKVQWTKTQKTYRIEIKNYYTGKNSDIAISNYTKTSAKKAIEKARETGELNLWTGHHISKDTIK